MLKLAPMEAAPWGWSQHSVVTWRPFPDKRTWMKAIQLVRPGEPLRSRDVPVPGIGRQDVLVRVKAAGICHSDAHYRAGRSRVDPVPLTLGHEVAGVLEAVGDEVAQFRSGGRVCLHYL